MRYSLDSRTCHAISCVFLVFARSNRLRAITVGLTLQASTTSVICSFAEQCAHRKHIQPHSMLRRDWMSSGRAARFANGVTWSRRRRRVSLRFGASSLWVGRAGHRENMDSRFSANPRVDSPSFPRLILQLFFPSSSAKRREHGIKLHAIFSEKLIDSNSRMKFFYSLLFPGRRKFISQYKLQRYWHVCVQSFKHDFKIYTDKMIIYIRVNVIGK